MIVAPRGLLDTNTLILLDEFDADVPMPGSPLISTITLAELSVGPLTTADAQEQSERQHQLQEAEASFDPIPFDRAAARAFGQVSASLRRAGRTTSARTYDAMIAAIAISRGLPLFTCNPSDFEGIDGLEVIAVPNPHPS